MPIYGRATTLWPRTLELWDQLDVLDAMLDIGVISKTGFNFDYQCVFSAFFSAVGSGCIVLTCAFSGIFQVGTLLRVVWSLDTAWTNLPTRRSNSREYLPPLFAGSFAESLCLRKVFTSVSDFRNKSSTTPLQPSATTFTTSIAWRASRATRTPRTSTPLRALSSICGVRGRTRSRRKFFPLGLGIFIPEG